MREEAKVLYQPKLFQVFPDLPLRPTTHLEFSLRLASDPFFVTTISEDALTEKDTCNLCISIRDFWVPSGYLKENHIKFDNKHKCILWIHQFAL